VKKLIKNLIIKLFRAFGIQLIKKSRFDLLSDFSSVWYNRHNQRRQEHLATLNLDIFGKTVLEVGAGIGDHTTFWLDRKGDILITEARKENLGLLRSRFPEQKIQFLDLDDAENIVLDRKFDIVYCYGLLYHLKNPEKAIEFMSNHCLSMLLLETCVSFGDAEQINRTKEDDNPTQAYSGIGCRPTRIWVFNQLKKYFEHIYVPLTQPAHPEFPLDWTKESKSYLSRAVFIASKEIIHNELLVSYLPKKQFVDINDYHKEKKSQNLRYFDFLGKIL